jgi:eukaryotic-like serine/threonine-protein kinase
MRAVPVLASGSRLGRFVLDRPLGKGAAGIVYLATDTMLKHHVAVKILHESLAHEREVRERFKREILLTRRVSHPGVARIHDMHEDEGLTYLTMEYVEGRTLAAEINETGTLPAWRTAQILAALAPPLAAAHAAGVVHRDLKPGNIMVKPDGRVAILDFGMATADDVARITKTGRTVGSLRFIAPEVWEGQPATMLSDLYAVGVILFACLAGRLPYDAHTPAQMFQALKGPIPSLVGLNPDVTPAIDAVVRKAMSRVPTDRYLKIDDLVAEFQAACEPGAGLPAANNVNEDSLPRGETIALTASQLGLNDKSSPTSTNTAPMRTHRALPVPAMIAGAVLVLIVVGVVVAALVVDPPKKEQPQAVAAEEGEPEALAADAGVVDDSAQREARDAVLADMKRKGILPGDVPKVDRLLAQSKSQSGEEAAATIAKAKALVAKTKIDRGFITTKLKRLHAALEKAPTSTKDKVRPIESQIEKKQAARDYEGANAELNRAFAIIR